MKKIVYTVMAIAFPLLASAQNEDSVGNKEVSNFQQIVNFQPNFTAGIKCSLNYEATVTSLGLIGKKTGAEVKLALYSDLNGTPNELLAYSDKMKVTNGEMHLKVKPTILPAGDYWIMGVYNEEGSHAFSNNIDLEKTVYYKSMDFGAKFPASAYGFESYQGHDFAYFLNLKTGSKGFNSEVSIYPNPAFNMVNVTNETGKEMKVELFDFLGNRKAVVQSEEAIIAIDLTQMTAGRYIVLINNSISKQIVKK